MLATFFAFRHSTSPIPWTLSRIREIHRLFGPIFGRTIFP